MDKQFRADDSWTEDSGNAINKYRFEHENGLIVDFNLQRQPMSQLFVKTKSSKVGFGCRFMGAAELHTEKLKRCLKFPDDIHKRERENEQRLIQHIERIQNESDIVTDWRKTDSGGIVYTDKRGDDIAIDELEDHIDVEVQNPVDVF